MNREDQKKITKNLIALRKTMQNDVEAIADKLCDAGVISKDARNEIANVRPNIAQLKCGVMINKLLRSGPGAYDKFVQVLEDLNHFDLVDSLEKTVASVAPVQNTRRQEEREKTFVIKNSTISERLRIPASNNQSKVSVVQGQSKGSMGQGQNDNEAEEVHQLERMMTFVMTSMENRESNKNRAEFKREFKQRLHEEAKGNDQLMGFFKTLRYNSFSLTSQSLAH